MAGFKVVISDPKSRKAYQREVDHTALVGKKVGEKVSGSAIGLDGYTIEITGGSDREGFPMRKDVEGQGRKRIVLSHPPGFHPERKGQRQRKSVRGNTISQDIVQVNAKVLEYGKMGIEEIFGVKAKEEDGKTAKADHSKQSGPQKTEAKAEPKEKEHNAEKIEKKSEAKEQKKEDQAAAKAEKDTTVRDNSNKLSGDSKQSEPDTTAKSDHSKQSVSEKAEEKMGVKKLED